MFKVPSYSYYIKEYIRTHLACKIQHIHINKTRHTIGRAGCNEQSQLLTCQLLEVVGSNAIGLHIVGSDAIGIHAVGRIYDVGQHAVGSIYVGQHAVGAVYEVVYRL